MFAVVASTQRDLHSQSFDTYPPSNRLDVCCARLNTQRSRQVLLKRRLRPASEGKDGRKPWASSHLVLGTLSAVVGHAINGYLPMPDWCSVQPDVSVREPPKEETRAVVPAAGKSVNDREEDTGSFYSDRSPEYSSEDGSSSDPYDSASGSGSGSSSESSSGSVSGSESESESDSSSEAESGSSVGSESGSSSESLSDESSDSSGTKGEEGVGLLIMGSGASNNAATYGASAPAPHSQDLTGLVERMRVVDRENSASPQLGARPEGLGSLSMAGVRGPSPVFGGGAVTLSRATSNSSDLVADPEGDPSVSFPATLLRHQAGGGLQIDYRYSRGRTNSMSRPSTTLTLRLTLTNHRSTPIRRIRVAAPRDGTPMDAFPEIQALAAGATVTANLGIDFGGRGKEVNF